MYTVISLYYIFVGLVCSSLLYTSLVSSIGTQELFCLC